MREIASMKALGSHPNVLELVDVLEHLQVCCNPMSPPHEFPSSPLTLLLLNYLCPLCSRQSRLSFWC